jgi:hypothetical protein
MTPNVLALKEELIHPICGNITYKNKDVSIETHCSEGWFYHLLVL